MIADSLDWKAEPVLRAGEGVIFGAVSLLVSASVYLGILAIGDGLDMFRQSLISGGSAAIAAGIIGAACAGTLGGLLFSICLYRIPARCIVATALFYGIELWIISMIFISLSGNNVWRGMIKSWPAAAAFTAYGLVLGLAALSRRNGPSAGVVGEPRD